MNIRGFKKTVPLLLLLLLGIAVIDSHAQLADIAGEPIYQSSIGVVPDIHAHSTSVMNQV